MTEQEVYEEIFRRLEFGPKETIVALGFEFEINLN